MREGEFGRWENWFLQIEGGVRERSAKSLEWRVSYYQDGGLVSLGGLARREGACIDIFMIYIIRRITVVPQRRAQAVAAMKVNHQGKEIELQI